MFFKTFKYFTGILISGYIVYVLIIYSIQGKLILHPSSNFKMPPESFNLEQKFIYKQNGDSLYTWWKKNNDIGKTFIFFGGNSGNISGRLKIAEIAKSLNMNILLFDYTGFGLSSGQPRSKEDLFEDSKTAIEYLINHKNIAEENIILWARSMGGPIAANLATEYSVKALIFEGVMKSIRDIVMDMNLFKYNILPLKLILKYNFNTMESIKYIDEPILFLHSKEDSLVRYNHAQTLFSLTKNQKKQIIPLTGSHYTAHNISYDTYFNGIKKFLIDCM